MAVLTTMKSAREAAADHLGLFLEVTVDGSDAGAKTITISDFIKNRPSMEHFTHAYVTEDGVAFERIVQVPDADGVTTLSDNLAGSPSTVYVYFLLTPIEWRDILNRLLMTELEKKTDTDIAIVAGDNEYDLPATIQMRTDLLDVVLVDESTTNVWMRELGAYRLRETANGLQLVIPLEVLQNLDSSVEIRVTHRERYSALSLDTDTTTCPFPLVWTSLAAAAVDKIQTKHGEAVANKFEKARRSALRQKIKIRSKMIPPYEARDYSVDVHQSDFIDIPAEITDGSW